MEPAKFVCTNCKNQIEIHPNFLSHWVSKYVFLHGIVSVCRYWTKNTSIFSNWLRKNDGIIGKKGCKK